MNVLRTIQEGESARWMRLIFEEGPHVETGPAVPAYPPSFPFPSRVLQASEGEYLYLVHRQRIVGWGTIAAIVKHDGCEVGSDGNPVHPGESIVLDGPLNRSPEWLRAGARMRGFMGIRYVGHNLHQLPPSERSEIPDMLEDAGIEVFSAGFYRKG